MNKIIIVLFFLLTLVSCQTKVSDGPENTPNLPNNDEVHENMNDVELLLYINDSLISVLWEDNDSVKALKELVLERELVIDMSRYGGFEQVGRLPQGIVSDDRRMTTKPGDIVLYSSNSLVMFYGSNTWSYTRLGRMSGYSLEEIEMYLNQATLVVKIKRV